MKYTAFGMLREASGVTMTDYQYTGQRNEATTGLYNYVARWYDQVIGHFISADTIAPGAGNPAAYDRYGYVLYNLLIYTDPSGNDPWWIEDNPEAVLNYYQRKNGKKSVTDVSQNTFDLMKNALNETLPIDLVGFGITQTPYAIFEIPLRYGSHYLLSSSEKRYDIKINMKVRLGDTIALCGNEGCGAVDYSTPENILYGFVAEARKIDQRLSWLAAGALETIDIKNSSISQMHQEFLIDRNKVAYYDNPADKAAVDFGYYLFREYGRNMTIEQLQSALTTEIMSAFQQPQSGPVIADPSISTYNFEDFLQP